MAHKNVRHIRRVFDGPASQAGFFYQGKTRRGHHEYRHPDGRKIVVVGDLGSWRTQKNALAGFKRAARGYSQGGTGPDRKG